MATLDRNATNLIVKSSVTRCSGLGCTGLVGPPITWAALGVCPAHRTGILYSIIQTLSLEAHQSKDSEEPDSLLPCQHHTEQFQMASSLETLKRKWSEQMAPKGFTKLCEYLMSAAHQ